MDHTHDKVVLFLLTAPLTLNQSYVLVLLEGKGTHRNTAEHQEAIQLWCLHLWTEKVWDNF